MNPETHAPNGRTWKEMCEEAEQQAEQAKCRAETEAQRRVDVETQRDMLEMRLLAVTSTQTI